MFMCIYVFLHVCIFIYIYINTNVHFFCTFIHTPFHIHIRTYDTADCYTPIYECVSQLLDNALMIDYFQFTVGVIHALRMQMPK